MNDAELERIQRIEAAARANVLQLVWSRKVDGDTLTCYPDRITLQRGYQWPEAARVIDCFEACELLHSCCSEITRDIYIEAIEDRFNYTY